MSNRNRAAQTGSTGQKGIRILIFLAVLSVLLAVGTTLLLVVSRIRSSPDNSGNTVTTSTSEASDSDSEEETDNDGTLYTDPAPDDSTADSYEIPSDAYHYNGHSYYLYNAKEEDIGSFSEAEAYCESGNGHLAVIDDQDENDALYQYVLDSGLHLAFFGYSDEDEEGNWQWVQNGSGFENWDDGQPNNGAANSDDRAENYAEFSKDAQDGTWNDAPFMANTYWFICEWDGENTQPGESTQQSEETQPVEETQQSESTQQSENNQQEDTLDIEEMCSIIEQHYTEYYQPDGTYACFDSEVEETDSQYSFVLRYQMSNAEAEERMARGAEVLANVYIMDIWVDKATGTVTDSLETDTWNMW